MKERTSMLVALLLAALVAAPAAAGDKKADREKQMQRRLQQQMQQMQGQVAGLEQDKAQLGQDLAAAEKTAKAAGGRAARLARELKTEKAQREVQGKELEQAKQDLAATRERLAQTEARLADTAKNLARTGQTLAETEADKRRLEGVKARQERDIALCEDKNLQLYQTGRELMVRFEQKSCGEIMAQKEPFTGIKRVEIENLLEEYRDKLDGQKLIKPPGG